MSLRYDEFSDLLGGAAWDDALDRWGRSDLSAGRRQSLSPFAPRFSSPNQFLFSEERERYPLEIFWLKWNLFSALCRRIQNIHQEHRRPLLNLQPSHLHIKMGEPIEDFLPVRWAFSLDTSNLQLADRFTPPNLPPEVPAALFAPPPDAHPLYAPPPVRRHDLEQRETATLLVRTMERMRGSSPDEVRGIVQAQLVSEHLRPSDYLSGDLFLVTLPLFEEGAGPVRIWANKRASAERGLLLEGTTEPVAPGLWEQFERAKQKVFSRSEVLIYKSLHLPCDFYSLGMILFRTLLVNDLQEIDAVHRSVARTAEQLGPIFLPSEDRQNQLLLRRVRFLLRKEGEAFSKNALLFRKEEREGGCDAIPEGLWTEALFLGFRLVQNQGENALEQSAGVMERIVAGAEHLGNRIKMELFGSRLRNREILEACDQVRKELSEVRNG